MKNLIKTSLLCVSLFSTYAYAENESRMGWAGGFGIGAHSVGFSSDDFTPIDNQQGLASSLNIGYNFTEQMGVYYVRNASWYTTPNTDKLFASGISGIGATYFFKPEQKTFYASVVLGFGDHTNVDDSASEVGVGFMATVGYEFAAHWQGEISLLKTSIEDDYDEELDTTTVQFLINYSWY